MDLLISELDANHVRMKDRDEVIRKINQIKMAGARKLQIITDFDRTLTKHTHNCTSQNIYKLIPTLPQEFRTGLTALYNKYHGIEDDPNISIQDKIPYMEEWWRSSRKLFIGLPFDQEQIVQAVDTSGVELRTGAERAFTLVHEHKVPMLVFSAGLGNVVEVILNKFHLYMDNVKVISNFLKVENDQVVGFKDEPLHIFNKNEHAIENTDYFKVLSGRENVILMGDSVGDANMAEGVEGNGDVLKIGFLSSHADGWLPQYLERFDIVLLNDETLDVFNAILKAILQ